MASSPHHMGYLLLPGLAAVRTGEHDDLEAVAVTVHRPRRHRLCLSLMVGGDHGQVGIRHREHPTPDDVTLVGGDDGHAGLGKAEPVSRQVGDAFEVRSRGDLAEQARVEVDAEEEAARVTHGGGL